MQEAVGPVVSDVSTVTVIIPTVAITTVPDPQSICVGGDVTLDIVSDGLGTPTYSWYYTSPGSTSVTVSTVTTTTTYTTPVLTQVGDYEFYVSVSYDGLECASVDSSIYTVTVVEGPEITTQPLPIQEICEGGTPETLSVGVNSVSGTGNAFIYQWYSNTTDSTVGGAAILGANASTYTPVTTPPGVTYYYVEVSQDESGCVVLSNTSSVIVTSLPSITDQPTPLTEVCVDGVVELSVAVADGVGTPDYQWFENTTNSNLTGTEITGATNATYTPNTSVSGIKYYYVEISYAGGCSPVVSDVSTVTVIIPTVAITTVPDPQSICVGGDVTLDIVSDGLGTPTYSWYYTSPGSTSVTVSTVTTTTTYTTPVLTQVGNYDFYVSVSYDGLECTSVDSSIYTVTVVDGPDISTQPQLSQEVCQISELQPLFVIVSGGISSIYTYKWYSNTINSNIGGTLIAGANQSIYTPNVTVSGTIYYYVEVSQLESGCISVSEVSEVTIREGVNIIDQPESNDLCIGGSVLLNVQATVNVGQTLSYQWYYTDLSGIENLISGANNSSYQSPPLTNPGDYSYYVIISTDDTACSIKSNNAIIRVFEEPMILTQPSPVSQEICKGALANTLSVKVVTPSNSGDTIFSYQWFSNVTNSNIGGTEISGEVNDSYTPSTNIVGVTYYYVMISQGGPQDGCEVASDVSAVTVVASPDIFVQPEPLTKVCADEVVELLVTVGNGIGVPDYQWYSNTSNSNLGGILITGETSDIYSPDTSISGVIYYYVEINYPLAGCGLIVSNVAKVETLEKPQVEIMSITSLTSDEETICVGGQVTMEALYTGGLGIPDYQWYYYTTDITSVTQITGATSSTYTTEPILFIDVYNYYVELTFDNSECNSVARDEYRINVVSDPVLQNNGNLMGSDGSTLLVQDTCLDSLLETLYVDVVSLSGSSATVFQYQWYANTIESNIGGVPISGAIIDSYTPQSILGINYYYVVVSQPESGCEISSNVSKVIVNDPTIAFVIDTFSSCINGDEIILEVELQNGFGTPEYQWYSNTINSTSSGVLIPGETSSSYSPPLNDEGEIFYYVEVNFGVTCDLITSNIASVLIPDASSFMPKFRFQSIENQDLVVEEVNDTNDADTNDDGVVDLLDDIDLFGESEFSIQDPIQFSLLDSSNFLTIAWDFGDGSDVQNTEDVTFKYSETGLYKIALTVLHNSGCTFTREKWIKISQEQLAYPNAFTPNGDYKNETIKPFQKSFKQFQFSIYNSWGQLMYSESLEIGVNDNGFRGWDGIINGKPAESGNYIMIISGVTLYGKEVVKNIPITLIK